METVDEVNVCASVCTLWETRLPSAPMLLVRSELVCSHISSLLAADCTSREILAF